MNKKDLDKSNYIYDKMAEFEEGTNISKESMRDIISYTKDKTKMVRDDAANALSYFPYEEAEDVLNNLLDDKSWEVKTTALWSLEIIGKKKQTVDHMIECFKKDKGILNRFWFASTIPAVIINGDLEKEDYIKKIIELKRNEKVPSVYGALVYALISLGKEDYFSEIVVDAESTNLERVESGFRELRWLAEDGLFLDKISEIIKAISIPKDKQHIYVNYDIEDTLKTIKQNNEENKKHN